MGTSGAYGGSGGAWNGAKRELADLLSGGDTAPADVLGPAAGALDWDDGTTAVDGDTDEETGQSPPIPLAGTDLPPIRIRPRRGVGGSDGQARSVGGRRGVRTGRAAGGPGGGRRSRQRAARLGAGVAAAGYALRARDTDALLRLGLELAELAGLTPVQQARLIIDVVVGPASTIEDAEIVRATSSMIIRLLEAEVEPDPAEVVRIFAIEYVFEICLTELGEEMRDGTRDGGASVRAEDDMRELIEARVASLKIEGEAIEADALEAAIDEVLEFTRRVIHERPGE